MTTCTPTQDTVDTTTSASPQRTLADTASPSSLNARPATSRTRAIDEPRFLFFVFLLHLPFLLLLTWLLSQLSSMPEPVHP